MLMGLMMVHYVMYQCYTYLVPDYFFFYLLKYNVKTLVLETAKMYLRMAPKRRQSSQLHVTRTHQKVSE